MFKMVSSISFIAVVAVLLLHYLVFRLGRRVADSDTATIHRYSVFERFVHLGAMLAFCTAALTGFGSAIMFAAPPMGWLKLFHIAAGGTLAGCVVLMALLWAMDATFTTIDWQWVKLFGGHFSRKHFPPAERFDAGQKIFFWLTVGLGLATLASGMLRVSLMFSQDVLNLALLFHKYIALLFAITVIGHVYFSTLAKPGALRGMIRGSVRRGWAERYHSLWRKRVG